MIGYLRMLSVVPESDDNISNAYFRAPVQLFALRRLPGYLANLEHAIWVANSPWMVWSLFGTLTMIFAQGLTLDFGTLTMISRCGPFMAGLLFADIVDELLLSAAIVHLLLGTVGQVPQCISAHNCDTKTMLRLMAFLDLCIGSTIRWSLLCSRQRCVSQSQFAAVSRPDGIPCCHANDESHIDAFDPASTYRSISGP